MAKRNKLEILRDILKIVQDNKEGVKPTPLLRKSNMSTKRFKEYYGEILKKGFVRETGSNTRLIILTDKGARFLMKYQAIVSFIDEFDL